MTCWPYNSSLHLFLSHNVENTKQVQPQVSEPRKRAEQVSVAFQEENRPADH